MVDVTNARPTGEPPHSGLSGLFVEGVPADGASISVVAHTGNHSVISSTGALAGALEQLQFEVGEGPHWEALATGSPVLVADIRAPDAVRWPTFAQRAAELDVRGLFALPMTLGAAVVGVVDLCRAEPGTLTDAELRYAVSLARQVTGSAVHLATSTADGDEPSTAAGYPEMRREVHQATGMLVAQLDISITDAFATLRAYAYSHERPVEDVAADIVHRRLDLTEPTP